MAKLFTPGPLNTTLSVKEAMLHDLGSRDTAFLETVKQIRHDLVALVNGDPEKHTVVPLQGAGSYAVESVFANVIGKSNNKALILASGAYAYRMISMCQQADYPHKALVMAEENPIDLTEVENELKENGTDYALVASVHCETSTGIFNPIVEIAQLVAKHSAYFFVDAMSSLGAVPLDMSASPIHFVVSSANKCLQGVPGFAYVIADKTALATCAGRCRSWSFDLCAQLKGLESNGQFRCTPPTHSMLAFKRALDEFHAETFAGRIARYRENNCIIRGHMHKMGFKEFDAHLDDTAKGYIITSFYYPSDPNFNFHELYQRLSAKQLVIYPGKVSKADTFRLGNIGDLHPSDCQVLCREIQNVLKQMKVQFPVTYKS